MVIKFLQVSFKASSRWSILLTKNVAFINVFDHAGNCGKIDGISKIRDSINNLKAYQKYQNGFVIFDAESNFEHIYPVFTLLSFFNFVKK